MNATQSYALSKKYTDNSILGIAGVLAGKNCTIKSSVHENGVTTMVFEWVADTGETRETQIEIYDGTPIYVYTPGDTYHYGDLCIYSGSFYRCIHEHVAPATMIDSYWDPIGNTDGNYGIVETSTDLPSRYTPADRKLFYVMDEAVFYLWDGSHWQIQEESITNDEIDALFA